MNRKLKVSALTAANSNILEKAAEAPSSGGKWDFFCECGRPECQEPGSLTIEAFGWLRRAEFPVLAEGHRLSQVARARMLRSEAVALRAQARAQVARARNNLRN